MGPYGQPGSKGEPGHEGEIGPIGPMSERGTPGNPGNDGIGLPGKHTATLLPGTSFDLETGTFTCSVSGTYVFMFSMNKYPSSSYLYVQLRKNDDVVVSGYSTASNHHEPMSRSAVLVLQQGDTVYLTMHGRVGGYSSHDTSFSGFLLYPE
ncbi:complement C1q subcomponent subunit C-like [Patiria miniata]|uniref:C1q domain-containing protein n=1 Tax=Patiria miniata TaxID=46514 RepID=A0A914BP36_PATMI|nr:complement C1q subcomponent subunit C-like [Patiria miniata]